MGIYKCCSIGRFASADTLIPDPSNPQDFNRYTYVRNNAINFTDPTGHYIPDASEGSYECSGFEECENDAQTGGEFNGTCGPGCEWYVGSGGKREEIYEDNGDDRGPEYWPDYTTFQGSFNVFTIGITMDTYSNVYVSGGFSYGIIESLAYSARLAGGWIAATQESTGRWLTQSTVPTESQLERHLTGPSISGSAGLGVGADVVLSGLDSILPGHMLHSMLGVEAGLYSPQFGISAVWGFLLHDN